MTDLTQTINDCISELRMIYQQSASLSTSGSSSIPFDCYRYWQQQAGLHASLNETLELFPMRNQAWTIINSILNDENLVNRAENIVKFCNQEMPFATARHLALSAYLTISWTIYDRLSNICGRLSGHEKIAKNPLATSNPKLVEYFLREGNDKFKQLSFSLSYILPTAYGWSVSVSYFLRNWLIHEGLIADEIPLFRGDNIGDGFELSDAAMNRIEGMCNNDGFPHSKCCLSGSTAHPWYDKTIITILNNCNSEIDLLFCSLLKWSVSSFGNLFSSFSNRDT